MENVEKIDFSDKKVTDMEDKITKAVTANLKDLLTQILEKQQPKQEVFYQVTGWFSAGSFLLNPSL